MNRPRLGCGTHLLIAFGLFVVAVGVIAYQNRDTVSMMWANVTAMNEGMALTEELRYPEDVLDYLAAHPESTSLVAYDVGRAGQGIAFQAEDTRAMVNLSNIVVLAAYADAVASGTLDAAERVPVADISRRTLPGVNAQPHQRTLEYWESEGALDADSTIAVSDLVQAVARFNDDPSFDWLIDELGRPALEAQTTAMGFSVDALPMPKSGLYLEWAEAAPALRSRSGTTQPVSTEAVYAAASRYAADTTYAGEVRDRFRTQGTNLTLSDQRLMAQGTLPKTTAQAMGDVLGRMASATPPDPQAEAFAMLDRSAGLDTLTVGIERVASKGGAMPGVISFAGVAHYAEDRPPRVVVVFMEDVPLAVFYHLLQSGLDQGLGLQLLGDDAFFERARERFSPRDEPTEPVASGS